MIALEDTNMKTSSISDIASFHDKLLQFSPLEWQGEGGIQSDEMRIHFNISASCAPSVPTVASGASPLFVCLSFCCTFQFKVDRWPAATTRSYLIRKYLWSRSCQRNIWEIIYKRQVIENTFKRIPGTAAKTVHYYYCVWYLTMTSTMPRSNNWMPNIVLYKLILMILFQYLWQKIQ